MSITAPSRLPSGSRMLVLPVIHEEELPQVITVDKPACNSKELLNIDL
jgi:hypothetical protein